MVLTTENILLVGSALLLLSIFAGKSSYKFGVPTIIFFLLVGILAGSDGIGGIYFNDPSVAQFIGIVALNFILFSGGLETNWKTVRPVLWHGISLSTLGVLLTTLTVGLFVYWITDFSLYEGLLLGAIISSTDAAAVFSILRSKNLALKSNLRPTLELESGSNDPMAYFLTIAFTGMVMEPEKSFFTIIPLFFKQFIIGGLAGYAFGRLGKIAINRIRLDYDGLYPVFAIALMFFTFSLTDYLGGNGFLAVYISAVYLGNHELIHKNTILKSFDGFAWLMQIVLFLTLGLLVFPSEMVQFTGIGLIISAFLILVARPLSVFLSLSFFRMRRRNRWYISWVGLRGAVPIVFATYPLLAGAVKSQAIFNIVFFISLTSVLIQGTTLPRIARWLRVSLPQNVKAKSPFEAVLADEAKSNYMEVRIEAHSPAAGKKILDLNFPRTAIIATIRRDGKFLVPKGSTVILENDVLTILAENEESLLMVSECLAQEKMAGPPSQDVG